ncbi:MAG: hypothetical protein WAO09_10340 [Candidatus Dormiibacterota bacterium]|jgi:hypothetical protein
MAKGAGKHRESTPKESSGTETVAERQLEAEYWELFGAEANLRDPLPEGSSLAQPSPLAVVPIVQTRGAYELPLVQP